MAAEGITFRYASANASICAIPGLNYDLAFTLWASMYLLSEPRPSYRVVPVDADRGHAALMADRIIRMLDNAPKTVVPLPKWPTSRPSRNRFSRGGHLRGGFHRERNSTACKQETFTVREIISPKTLFFLDICANARCFFIMLF